MNTLGERVDFRHEEWQKGLQLMTFPADQSIWGLCLVNQEWPKNQGGAWGGDEFEHDLLLVVTRDDQKQWGGMMGVFDQESPVQHINRGDPVFPQGGQTGMLTTNPENCPLRRSQSGQVVG